MGVLDSLLASSVISCARMCVCVCVCARACIHTQVTRRGRATGTREWHRQSSQKSAGREAAAAVRVVSAGDLIIRHVQLLDRDARVASLHSSRAHGRRPEQHQKAPAYCPTHPTSRRAPPRSPQTWSARSSSAASGQRQVAMTDLLGREAVRREATPSRADRGLAPGDGELAHKLNAEPPAGASYERSGHDPGKPTFRSLPHSRKLGRALPRASLCTGTSHTRSGLV
jgi:hypothetical protein